MKKQIRKTMVFLLAFSMLSLSGTAMVSASNAQENTVTYDGKQYNKDALSQETIDWQAKDGVKIKAFEAGSELGGTSAC